MNGLANTRLFYCCGGCCYLRRHRHFFYHCLLALLYYCIVRNNKFSIYYWFHRHKILKKSTTTIITTISSFAICALQTFLNRIQSEPEAPCLWHWLKHCCFSFFIFLVVVPLSSSSSYGKMENYTSEIQPSAQAYIFVIGYFEHYSYNL